MNYRMLAWVLCVFCGLSVGAGAGADGMGAVAAAEAGEIGAYLGLDARLVEHVADVGRVRAEGGEDEHALTGGGHGGRISFRGAFPTSGPGRWGRP